MGTAQKLFEEAGNDLDLPSLRVDQSDDLCGHIQEVRGNA
jgi:hypothetical protein